MQIREWNCRTMAMTHGGIYLVSGLWPLLSMKTFETVTGPKKDHWLVKTVGLLITVSGVTLLKSGIRSNISSELALLGAGQALSLGSISLIYSLMGRISKIYLLDTLMEYGLAFLWYLAWTSTSRTHALKKEPLLNISPIGLGIAEKS